MNGLDLRPLFGIPAYWTFQSIPSLLDILPKELITGDLKCKDGSKRCSLRYLNIVNQGGYGCIQRVQRDVSGESAIVACKRPTLECQQVNMAQEAFIQHVALIVVEQAGFLGAIPKVYDVYRYGDECRFTMDYIDGRSSLDELYRATDPGTTFIQILAQVCFILLTLESKLHLDHRDMKMTNLWIRKKPVSYIFTDSCTGLAWHTAAPFQVVLLDFGFACLGSTEGHALLNLGDGVFPDLDPCPKEGRDLFQCIVSLWSVDAVRDRLPADIQEEVAGWLTTYADLAKRFTGSSWSYAVTSDPKFRFSNLHPAAVLMRLARRWPAYVSFNG